MADAAQTYEQGEGREVIWGDSARKGERVSNPGVIEWR